MNISNYELWEKLFHSLSKDINKVLFKSLILDCLLLDIFKSRSPYCKLIVNRYTSKKDPEYCSLSIELYWLYHVNRKLNWVYYGMSHYSCAEDLQGYFGIPITNNSTYDYNYYHPPPLNISRMDSINKLIKKYKYDK